MKKVWSAAMFCAAAAAAPLAAHAAPAVLDTGLIRMGIGDDAGLGQNGVGLVGPTGDAITPGCLCEGWGAAAGGNSGYTYGGGRSGISSALTTAPDTDGADLSAQSVVVMSNGLQVTHSYSYAASGTLFRVAVEMLNQSGGALTDVRYARTLDWDVTPGFFSNNFTTVYGGTPTGPGGKVLTTSTNPFAVPDPLVFRGQEQDTNVTNSAGDKGGFFVFGFGDLADGESATFTTYIGADGTIGGLLDAFAAVGVEAYSYTTGNGTGFSPAYGYGFVGLDLPPVFGDAPEPNALALAGLGLLAAAVARRRRV